MGSRATCFARGREVEALIGRLSRGLEGGNWVSACGFLGQRDLAHGIFCWVGLW